MVTVTAITEDCLPTVVVPGKMLWEYAGGVTRAMIVSHRATKYARRFNTA